MPEGRETNKKPGLAAADVLSLAVALSFASATDAEAQGKGQAGGDYQGLRLLDPVVPGSGHGTERRTL
jgi:hypothetical protein